MATHSRPVTANKTYSGKFNLRVGEALHERLAVAALKADPEPETFCVKASSKKRLAASLLPPP